jgi:hypothetical protein
MKNFTDNDAQEFGDKLVDTVNKITAGHMIPP